jgi:hypothetical protein
VPLIAAAVASLEPEEERARRVIDRLGPSPRTLRRLASKGFREETLEPLVADVEGGDVP